MADQSPSPNELADLYDGLFTLLDQLPEQTHPGWRFAVETVLFGGEGLVEDALPYGAQQADRNEFAISTYRDEYGDGTYVTDFPAVEVKQLTPADNPTLDDPIELPLSPVTQTVLPLSVTDRGLSTAIALLAEFPAEPEADTPGAGQQTLLDPARFPAIDDERADEPRSSASTESPDDSSHIEPNELAELYEALRSLFESLPEETHPVWEEALETILYGGEALLPDRIPYGEQQAERNEFKMRDYRQVYGDGDLVTTFSIIGRTASHEPRGSDDVLLSPESGSPLPLSPAPDELRDALLLLEEMPSFPDAERGRRSTDPILDTDQLLENAYLPRTHEPDEPNLRDTNADASPTEESTFSTGSESDVDALESDERKSFQSGVGESAPPTARSGSQSSDSQTYEDPRAQQAHERAQKRDPSEIVGLGDEITLILQEVDHSSRSGTVMGRKNDLVIFVDEVPQDVSQYDAIHATVVDYGSDNNCAKAVFTGYGD